MQVPCSPGKQGELSENCLQNLRNDLMADSVDFFSKLCMSSVFYRKSSINFAPSTDFVLGPVAAVHGEQHERRGGLRQHAAEDAGHAQVALRGSQPRAGSIETAGMNEWMNSIRTL